MADNKIRITADEAYSTGVDAKLKQQEVLARAQAHYQQAVPSAPPPLPVPGTPPLPVAPYPPGGKPSIWYQSVCYMAVFGLAGGLLAWAFSELISGQRALEDPVELARLVEELDRMVRSGRMTEAEALREFDQALRELERKGDIASMLFYVVVGIIIAVSLAIADPVVTRNWRAAVINGSVGAVLGLLGGLLLSFFIDDLFRGLVGDPSDFDRRAGFRRLIFARAAAWAVLGIFLTSALGIVMRSWKRLAIGVAGGFLGGLLGGLLFDPISLSTQSGVLSRAVAVSAIGLLAGLATGLIENAAKTGWLRVTAGLIAGKHFVLYRNPTYVGSSPQCEIYLFKDPQVAPRHAAIQLIPGGFVLQDLTPNRTTFVNGQAVAQVRLRGGDQVQIGSTCFLFEEKSASPAAAGRS